jgi:hypothetical protein
MDFYQKRSLFVVESVSHPPSITRPSCAGPSRGRDLHGKINQITILSRRPTGLERRENSTKPMGGDAMNRPRAADDFATIRARMEELRREREAVHAAESEAKSDAPMRSNRNAYWSQREIGAAPGQVRQSGPTRS